MLEIHNVLADLTAALESHGAAVLVAPPGAGKTTAVAPALLGEEWCTGSIIMLSPRRVAARAAAERMAEVMGEKAGQTVGYVTRLDRKRSSQSRIVVMTEAIFVATIMKDPELSGVSAVLFDEAHERHLYSDLGLALAIEALRAFRPDLRLLVMSATIDGVRFAELLDHAPVIESRGKAYPLEVRWIGTRPELGIDEAVTHAIAAAWHKDTGDILAFLPGVRQIEQTKARLEARLPEVVVLPLHGQCEPRAQQQAIARDPGGTRRIVLATAIAETSLTLDGICIVIDSGLSRHAEFDRSHGTTRLVTRASSQASAAQRAGRAARQGPGIVYRLWEKASHPGRPKYDSPEILTQDLAGLVLMLAEWGETDPANMAWLDPPPGPSVVAARILLQSLGALDDEGQITAHGRKMAALPLEPPLAHMLLFGASHGAAHRAARLALLLQERGLGGRGDDLAMRLARWDKDRSSRAIAARKLAEGWARRVTVTELARKDDGVPDSILLVEAYPGNLARRRDRDGAEWLTASGRGLWLDPLSSHSSAEWLAIGDAQGKAQNARITGAMAISRDEVEQWLSHRITHSRVLRWIEGERRAEPLAERRIGAILLSRGPDLAPDDDEIRHCVASQIRKQGLNLLPLSDKSQSLLSRSRFAGIESLSDAALFDSLEEWAGPLLGRRVDDINKDALHHALVAQLSYAERQILEKTTPRSYTTPAGTSHDIDYEDPAGPSVEVRVQALFGLDSHPCVGEPALPLLLKLTSPAGRVIQTTRNLPGFWRGSWQDVRRDMKGRYPKHRWPDAPWAEAASLRTKAAFSREQT